MSAKMPEFDPQALISSIDLPRIEIARLSGLSKSTITRLAQGDVRNPGIATVERLQFVARRVPPLELKSR